MLQKANVGEQQDGVVVPFYQGSILYQYLLIYPVGVCRILTHPFSLS